MSKSFVNSLHSIACEHVVLIKFSVSVLDIQYACIELVLFLCSATTPSRPPTDLVSSPTHA